ncbi:MAG: hypothetical protein ACHQ53_11600 [Polyangiales bacterium]
MSKARLTLAPLLLLPCLAFASPAHAERNTLGPHLGFSFDSNDVFLGAEGRFDVAEIDQSVIVQLNPSFSLYFVHNVNVFNFSFNVPFEFKIHDSVLRPFAAPGLGIYAFTGRGGEARVRLNLIGGLLFKLRPPLEPYVQIRLVAGGGIAAELMTGLLFRL